jgi:hypothetical protein
MSVEEKIVRLQPARQIPRAPQYAHAPLEPLQLRLLSTAPHLLAALPSQIKRIARDENTY